MKRHRRWLAIVAAPLAFLLLRTQLLDWRRVTGHSMEPTLLAGDLFLCNRAAYGWRPPGAADQWIAWDSPQAGELVLIVSPLDGQVCIKRAAAAPANLAVPTGHVWVVGDNSRASLDSRAFGPLSADRILGRVICVRH